VTEPLEGIRVVELSTGVLGPLAGAYLSDMGAEVIKVEPPEGDLTRYVRGKGNQTPPETPGPMWLMGNRGKRSVTLDAFGEHGRRVIEQLIASADVLLTNFRPEALAAMGVDDETVLARHPRLVYASATGWGRNGPDADRMMVDGAAQARGGIASVTGERGDPPSMVGALIADTSGAMHLALAVMTALVARERHGIGQRVDVAALGSIVWLQAWELTHASLTGFEPTRAGAHHPIFGSNYGIYETSDGHAFFLAQLTRDEDWRAFCAHGGRPDLATDERWATTLRRIGIDPACTIEDDIELQRSVREIVASRSRADWTAFFQQRPDIIAEAVRSHLEVLTDPQMRANDLLVDLAVPGLGTATVVGNLVGLSVTPGSVKGPPPALGADTEPVLASLGYDGAAIATIVQETRDAVARRFGTLRFQPPSDDG